MVLTVLPGICNDRYGISSTAFVFRQVALGGSLLLRHVLPPVELKSPVFDTHTVPDPTPCDAVRFSWTGGVPPFVVFLDDPETLSIVSKSDDTEDHFVTWTPPPSAVGMTLMATVFDGDLSFDTTDEFVVQPASCLSASPPVPPASSVGLQPSTTPSTSLVHHTSPPISISPIRNSTDSSETPHVAPSTSPSLSSPPPQPPPPQESSSISHTGDRASTVLAHSITGAASAAEISASSRPSTTSHRRSTRRPRRKSSDPSPSPSEIVGIILGSVALVDRGGVIGRERKATAVQSSNSTLVPQPEASDPISNKVIAHRHQSSAASPTTPALVSSAASSRGPLMEEDASGTDSVLHIHDSTDVNTDSVAVEPSTSTWRLGDAPILDSDISGSLDLVTVPQALPAHAGRRDPTPGGASATEVETKGRAGSRSHDMGISTQGEPGRTGTAQTEEEGEALGEAAPGPRSRARRVTLLFLENDGVVRLVGGLPDVTVEPEGGVEPAVGESLSDSDGLVDIDITRLPPPYHRYNT
ncbi:hypothetical protein V8D89_014765 [Ganoderma adspersum]